MIHAGKHVAHLRTACIWVGAEKHLALLPDLIQRFEIFGVRIGPYQECDIAYDYCVDKFGITWGR